MATSGNGLPGAPFAKVRYGSIVVLCEAKQRDSDKHWIEIELLAEDSSPIAYEECWLKPEGRDPINGFLNEKTRHK